MTANEKDIAHLEELYGDRRAYFGDLHDHSDSGGRSDGKRPLSHWLGAREALGLDFVTILDHHQVRHMYEPEWDGSIFIGGSEPGARILDGKGEVNSLHYNMVFAEPEPLQELVTEFTEFKYTGGPQGFFGYPSFTRERFCELIDAVYAHGGHFVHPHPKQVMKSDDPCDYWFRDETAIEVNYRTLESQWTADNYALWTELLARGKRLWASAGHDGHACASDKVLTTIYAEEKSSKCYLSHLRVGDYVCGAVGIRMCVGDTRMGSKCNFAGERVVISVADFHSSVRDIAHTYRVDILDDGGVIHSSEMTSDGRADFAFDASEDARFYRVEVYDVTRDLRISIGNPIWNVK